MDLGAIFAGVVSSLTAIGLVEGYLMLKRTYYRRALKMVLGLHKSSCLIVAPIFRQNLASELIHHRDAYAFGHIFELCHRLNVEAKLVPFNKISEIAEAEDTFSIGGPLSNDFTNTYLRRYLPAFRLVYQEEANDFKKAILTNGHYVTGFCIGDRMLLANDDEEYGLLIKLSEDELDQSRTVHLIFGYSGRGSAGAAYFLWKQFNQLFHDFGRGKYCIAVRVSRTEGYKVIPRSYIDLTKEAFGAHAVQRAVVSEKLQNKE